MGDGDTGGGDGDEDTDDADGDGVLDRFEIGDTIGTPSDSSNGRHESDAEADPGADAADADADAGGEAGPEPDSGGEIPTPRERASPEPEITTPRERAPPDAGNGDAATRGASDAVEGAERAGSHGPTDAAGPNPFEGDGPAFQETQRLRQRWLWVAVLGVSLFSVVTWLFNPVGQLLTVILLGVPAVGILGTYAARLETGVHEDGVHVRFFPLHRKERVVAYDDVTGVDSREFDAFSDFGGIGIRRTRSTWAYIATSGHGVIIERAEQPDVLIGTEHPEELRRAVEAGLSLSRGVEGGLDERWRAVANFEESSRIDT